MRECQRSVSRFVEWHRLKAPVQTRLLDLVSEVGELAKEVLVATAYGHRSFEPTDGWKRELGDALFSLICVANCTDVDLEMALEGAMKKYAQRLADSGDAGSGDACRS